ncbi:MAG TPA: winged helix-turn-helix domain-containing protein [Rhizomicrobium sp.]|jgi:DNA-binding winged helix-turn-helix (wHTH) protein/tetratricopeptide (TPR) repeat protein|nr:winged helix-turn-helix domain-containing protein [Rhizomicrobium sp.]
MDTSLRATGIYAFGRFRLDSARRSLAWSDTPVPLSSRVFDTLLYLVQNPGRLIEKDELLNAVWAGRFVDEANLSQTIFVLRKAFKDVGEADSLIATVSGRGYCFTAQVEKHAEAPIPDTNGHDVSQRQPSQSGTASISQPPAPAKSAFLPAARKRPMPRFAALAGCTIVLLAGAAIFVVLQRDTPPGPAAPNILVIADFQDISGNAALGTVLEKVLEVDLSQSPFLSLLAPDQVSETLKLMEEPADAHLTPQLAQEVCARNQGRAFLSGTVARLGSRYLVTLQSRDCASGRAVAEGKSVAARVEDLPGAIDDLALELRRNLSESPASISRFDVPIAQATTSSFEALKALSIGEQRRLRGDTMSAIAFYRRAIELDPQFALAYDSLGTSYLTLREEDLARPNLEKAFALRDRVSEIEKLSIGADYYQLLGDWTESERSYRAWAQIYPGDWRPRAYLAKLLTTMARYPEAIAAGKEALRIDPANSFSYVVLTRAFKRSSRFVEATDIAREAVRRRLDGWDIHALLYEMAFAQGDTAAMKRLADHEKGRPTECWMLDYEADAAAALGKLHQANALFTAAIGAARTQGSDANEEVSDFYADWIETLSQLHAKDEARGLARDAPGLDRNEDGSIAVAKAGDFEHAAAYAAAEASRYPRSTAAISYFRPITTALIDLGEGKPKDAIAALQPAMQYEMAEYDIPSLLGQAYLDTKQSGPAAAEYRKILANRGVDATSSGYPLAWLGLARALHLEGKPAESRSAYEHLFAFWKEADPDLPALLDARREYAAISNSAKAAE